MILELIIVRVCCIVWLFVWVYVVNWFLVWAVRALMVSVVLAGLPVWCRHSSEGRANQHYRYWAYQRSGNWANQRLTQAARITLYKFVILGTVFSSLQYFVDVTPSISRVVWTVLLRHLFWHFHPILPHQSKCSLWLLFDVWSCMLVSLCCARIWLCMEVCCVYWMIVCHVLYACAECLLDE